MKIPKVRVHNFAPTPNPPCKITFFPSSHAKVEQCDITLDDLQKKGFEKTSLEEIEKDLVVFLEVIRESFRLSLQKVP